jgi:hypothetical protein
LALGLPLFPLLDSVEDQRPKTKGQKSSSISDMGFGADLCVNRCSGIVRAQL